MRDFDREISARNVLVIIVSFLRFYLLPLLLPLRKYLQYTLISPRSCIAKGIKAPAVLYLRIRTLLKAQSQSVTEIAQIHPFLPRLQNRLDHTARLTSSKYFTTSPTLALRAA